MKPGRIAAAAALCLTFSMPAWAESYSDRGVTTEEVADVLHGKGFTAEIGTAESAEHIPIISSAAAGAKFTIFFYGCNHSGHCESIQFFAGYHHKGVGVETINRWNRDNRFGRAYLSRDSRIPQLELDVLTEQGFTSESLESYLDLWTMLMGRFQSYIGW
jgi:microsomal dipeptidase-like Zn-dependent dipeptidase